MHTIRTWPILPALVALACAIVLAFTACGDNLGPPVPVDARACDPVSCEAGMALECCPPMAAPRVRGVRIVSSIGGVERDGWTPDFGGFAGTSRGCMRSVSAGRFALPLPLDEGERMLSLTFSASNAVTSTFGFIVDMLSAAPDGSLTLGSVGTLAVNSAAPGPVDYTIDLVDTTVAGGVSYWIEFGAMAGGICVGALRLTYDRPGG